jgi:transposase InsO family protein
MPRRPPGTPRGDQRWSTFLRSHARAIVACDFCIAVTATFRVLYILIVMEHGTRRVLHCNVTAHPTAEWTLQQLREALPSEHEYRFLIHDRDSIFSKALDQSIRNLRLRVLKTPYRTPQANAICERFIGTLRRELLDWVIPLGENHLRSLLQIWLAHYNSGRPHMSLGPGVPDPPPGIPVKLQRPRHLLTGGFRVASRPLLGGLHHEYNLMPHTS